MGAPNARYFRLYCYDAQASYYRIGRLKALVTEGGADLCVGGTAFGNSDYYPPSRAFGNDNISDSDSWAGNPGNGRTIGYDFGVPTTFSYIVITNGEGPGAAQNAFSFDIQVSDDGTNWTTLMSVPFSARLSNGGLSYTYALATYTVSGVVREGGTPVGGRIVRVYRRDTGALLGETVSGDGVTPSSVSYTHVAAEGGAFTVEAGQTIRYGADTRWASKTFTVAGTYACNSTEFGGDPAYGTVKACQLAVPGDIPPIGSYSMLLNYDGEVQVVCLDDAAGTTYNDLIVRAVPV